MNLSIADILSATRGTLLAGGISARASEVVIDSRAAGPGSLFVPLRGTRHDGHAFIESAFTQGASAALTEHADAAHLQRFPGALIGVENTLRALGDIAAFWRRAFRLPLIGITGSNGKTTTKEMTAAIIGRSRACLKNEGNFNNLIGLPLSVVKLGAEHQAAVLEMGMSEPGEIRRLAEIAAPTIGVITNIGPCHLEQLGSLEAIAAAKGELFEALGPDDVALVNRDDEHVRALGSATRARVLTFGLAAGDIHAAHIQQDSAGGSIFELHIAQTCVSVRLAMDGAHFVSNALAAAAAAHAAGIGIDDIAAGLCASGPVAGRMQRFNRGGLEIINDAYNANPVSVRAALAALAATRRSGRAIAVLGDMLELGERSVDYHREIGVCAAQAGIDRLFVLGSFARHVCEGARSAGMPGNRICACESLNELAAELAAVARPGDVVLLKGSRRMQLEKLLDLLPGDGLQA
ncbi:MAG: UDP-N-acetylmuramoyl-tripeptide--D-alanyl-D-alanine ligase [Deltaproteobacteria bacterium]|nr:UDP-N-acetylmuramoyl-tripeptide--D-alanyl-D-alanine ligase [Deltaproteobacteria bacterium]